MRNSLCYDDNVIHTDYIKRDRLLCKLVVNQSIQSSSPSKLSYSRTELQENKYLASLNLNDSVIEPRIYKWRNLFETSSDLVTNERNFSESITNDYRYSIYFYTALILVLVTLTMVRSYLFFTCASNSSKNLHAKMFSCLLKAPMRFFDTNPSGRILNRFSKDTGAMDETLPKIFSEAIQVINVVIEAGL